MPPAPHPNVGPIAEPLILSLPCLQPLPWSVWPGGEGHTRPQHRASLGSHLRPLLLGPLKPHCHRLWVRPGRALKAQMARLEQVRSCVWGEKGALGGRGASRLPPRLLCLCRSSVYPALPSFSPALAPCPALSAPARLGPSSQPALLGCIWGCSPCLAQSPLGPCSPGACWTLPPTLLRGWGAGRGGASLTPGLWSTCSGGAPDP